MSFSIAEYTKNLWRAPELLNDPKCGVTKECDLYSYAMILYEIQTRKSIFSIEAKERQFSADGRSGLFHFSHILVHRKKNKIAS